MGIAKLEILKLEVPIGPCREYHDDGYVPSLVEHTRDLYKKYGEIFKKGEENYYKNVPGVCFEFNGLIKDFFHICYLDTHFEPYNIQVRGHEETHFSDEVDCMDLLKDKILEEQNVKINFKDIDNKEVRANLGSIYALYAHGMNSKMLEERLRRNRIYICGFDTAKRIYEKSRLPKKTIFIC